MRNILGHASRKIRAQIAEPLKLIFQAPDKKTARKLAQELINKFADKAETAMQVLEDGLENALTVLQLPKAYRQRLRTTVSFRRACAVTKLSKFFYIFCLKSLTGFLTIFLKFSKYLHSSKLTRSEQSCWTRINFISE